MSINLSNLKEPLVKYDLAVKLKKAGFNYPVTYFYKQTIEGKIITDTYISYPNNYGMDYNIMSENVSAPTLALAQKWLRDIHDIHVNPFRKDPDSYYVTINYPTEIYIYEQVISHVEKDYDFVLEDGLEIAIDSLLEFLNKKRKQNLKILEEEKNNPQPKLTKDEIYEILIDTLKDFCDEWCYNCDILEEEVVNIDFYKDLGFDELDHIEFILKIENELKISTNDIHFDKLNTISNLVDGLYYKQK